MAQVAGRMMILSWRQTRRWLHHHRQGIVIVVMTTSFAILTLVSISMVSGVRLELTSPAPSPSLGDANLRVMALQVTPEDEDTYARSSPLERERIMQERREASLHQGARCSDGPC